MPLITKKTYVEISGVKNTVNHAVKRLKEIQQELLLNLEFEKAEVVLPYDYAALHAEAEKLRTAITKAPEVLSDEAAVIVPDLFPAWDGNRAYKAGERFLYNGNLYRCKADNPVNPTWTPDVTHSYYEPVAKPSEDGTLTSPITAVAGMEYEAGKYYAENGKIYLCEREGMSAGDKITLYYLPSALVGQYFKEVAA